MLSSSTERRMAGPIRYWKETKRRNSVQQAPLPSSETEGIEAMSLKKADQTMGRTGVLFLDKSVSHQRGEG